MEKVAVILALDRLESRTGLPGFQSSNGDIEIFELENGELFVTLLDRP